MCEGLSHDEISDLLTFPLLLPLLFNTLVADLWSLPQQLLLLQSEPFLLDLLQSHLVVAPHDAWRERPALLHWGTLGDPLLVQGCRRRQKRG